MDPSHVSVSWGKPYQINKFSSGRLEEWVFGCDYPHNCVVRNRRGRFTSGHLFDSVIHLSKAYFVEGKLTEWSQ